MNPTAAHASNEQNGELAMDILGLITRTWIGLSPTAPAPHVSPVLPIVAQNGGTAIPAKKSAAEVVDEVQKFYASIQQVTALFRQSVFIQTFGTNKDSDGKLYIQKPGKMRWDYNEKKKGKVETKKSFISNGSYLYMVEHDNKQVVKKNLEKDLMPVAVSFLYGKGDLKAEFNAELDASGKYGGKGDIVLKMTPKKPSAQYSNLFLVVSPSDYHVTQSVIIDSAKNVNHFKFYSPDFKTAPKTTWFEFDPKSVTSKGYRVVDADEPKDGGAAPAPAPAPKAALPSK